MLDEILNPLNPYIGCPIGDLLHSSVHNIKNKGLAGRLIERALGAQSSNSPQPDLPQWGIEIKTLPITDSLNPLEHTFINKLSLPFHEHLFESSTAWQKLKKILWVPLIGSRKTPMMNKIIGQPFLWEPNEQVAAQLKADWNELTSYIRLGEFYQLSAHLGEYLHIRPKAANSSDKIILNINSQLQSILPIGFYLRKSFTQKLVEAYYGT